MPFAPWLAPGAVTVPFGETLLVGKPVSVHVGSSDRWGDVVRVEYVDRQGETIFEYNVPLQSNGNSFGELHLGISQTNFWH